MARGHIPGPQSDAWEQARTAIQGPWPEALVEMDLAYWGDPISCEGRRRPGYRVLAATWGWSPSRAQRFIAAWSERGSGAGHERVRSGSPVGHPTPDEAPQSEERGSPVGQERVTRGSPVGHPLIDTRARSSLVSRISEKERAPKGPPPGWEEAVETYQQVYRPAIGKRAHPPLQPSRGNGRHLATLLKRHGLEDTQRLLRHCATSPKRAFLREQGYDLQTLVRHSERYLDDADNEAPALRLASPSRPPDPGPRPPPPEEMPTLEELDALMAVVAGGRRAS